MNPNCKCVDHLESDLPKLVRKNNDSDDYVYRLIFCLLSGNLWLVNKEILVIGDDCRRAYMQSFSNFISFFGSTSKGLATKICCLKHFACPDQTLRQALLDYIASLHFFLVL